MNARLALLTTRNALRHPEETWRIHNERWLTIAVARIKEAAMLGYTGVTLETRSCGDLMHVRMVLHEKGYQTAVDLETTAMTVSWGNADE